MTGLELLPLPAREAVVLFAGEPCALPQVSEGTLAALKELELSLSYTSTVEDAVEEAVRQANAPRRAFDLGTLTIVGKHVADLSALAGCATLHTLDLTFCFGVRGVSALRGLADLREPGRIQDLRYL